MTQKAIFQYFDGSALVWGDPLKVRRDLYAALGDPDAVFAASDAGDRDAQRRIYAAVCHAFEMRPFDKATGEGATEEETDAALEALWDCLEKKNRNTAISPTSSPPTTSTPTPSPTTSSSV